MTVKFSPAAADHRFALAIPDNFTFFAWRSNFSIRNTLWDKSLLCLSWR